MKMLRIGLFLVPALCAAGPSAAVEYTIWHSPLLFEPQLGSGLVVEQGSLSSSIVVSTASPTDDWIQVPLTLPDNVNVKRVQLCYQVSDGATYVSQIRLSRMITPDAGSVYLDDATDRNSTTPVCETSTTSTLPVDGTYTLLLRLVFADAADTIRIGAIGIDVDEIVSSASLP